MTATHDNQHDKSKYEVEETLDETDQSHEWTLDRRALVRGGGASLATAAMGGGVIVHGQVDPAGPVVQRRATGPFATVMDRPDQVPSANQLQALTPHEAQTIDAITSRILPGTADDPGAHEAGVVTYIDTLLAFNQGYAEFTYLQGPWAQTKAAVSSSPATPVASPSVSGTPGATPMASPAANGKEGKTVHIEAGEYFFKPSSFELAPGDTLEMSNSGKIEHDMAVEDWNKTIIPLIKSGDSATYSIPDDAEVGASLTVYCTVPGHRQLGMEGTMNIVKGSSGSSASSQAPGQTTSTTTDYDVVMVDPEEIERYGYQSRLSPRDVYRIGTTALDRYAKRQFEQPFKDLDAKDQDKIVGDMAEGKIDNFDPELTAQSFFQNLRRHTTEGMFSDPAYGGNRNMVGWKLVGFPGAQRAYQPIEFQTEGTDRQPQSMADMHHFNPGENREDNDNVILPVSGSDGDHDHDSEP